MILAFCEKGYDRHSEKQRTTRKVKELKNPGRRWKTTKRDDRIIQRKGRADRYKTAPEMNAEMQIEHAVKSSFLRPKDDSRRHVLMTGNQKRNVTKRHVWNSQGNTKAGQLSSGLVSFSAMSQNLFSVDMMPERMREGQLGRSSQKQ